MEQPKIVVVGAGIIGSSIAWHLARAGARVTIVESGEAGSVATARSFAWINATWGNPETYFRLRHRAMADWHRLSDAIPTLPVSWTGSLGWDLSADEMEAFRLQHGGWGYGIRPVDQAEIREIEPHIARPPRVALHVPEEASVEPQAATRVLLQDAMAHGAVLLRQTSATGLDQRNGTVTGVETGEGVVAADEVVIASGTGTTALLATIGLSLPMLAPPGLLVHAKPHARLLNGIVLAPKLHMRQTIDGRIIAGSDFGGADPGAAAAATAAELFDAVKSMLSGSRGLELEHVTIGHRPTPAGGFPVIGRPGNRAGLFVAVMHSGVTLAPAVGRLVAEEMLTGHRDPLLSAYRPAASPDSDDARPVTPVASIASGTQA